MLLTELEPWGRVAADADAAQSRNPKGLFAAEPERVAQLSCQAAGLFIDASKQTVSAEGLAALYDTLAARDFSAKRTRFLTGGVVNPTEGRPALHPALRGGGADQSAIGAAAEQRDKARAFADAVRSGARTGASGRPLRNIVHIGIGGSDLGPRLIWEALKHRRQPGMDVRFAGNVDAGDINDALEGADPETTLVIVASKSFTTQETRLNAESARAWLVQSLGEAAAGAHIAAVTAKPDRAAEFGVAADAIFPFDEGVGGRYSLWSTVSMAVDMGLEAGAFDGLLAGAKAMDDHFAEAQMGENAPVLLAAMDVWNRNALAAGSRVVAPYSRRLRLLPAYLQQLEMESNGKGVDLDGLPAGVTSPVVWGAEGTNAQHAFFQQLHQGPDDLPVEFIGVLKDGEARPHHTRVLMAHLFAQGEALMTGRDFDTALAEGVEEGLPAADARAIAAHRVCPGGRGSTTILMDDLAPERVGALIALFEHKTFVNAVFWDINPFDQWGVELGKTLAKGTLATLDGAGQGHDPSTAGLIGRAKAALGDG